MTETISGLVVTLDEGIREDQAKLIASAIRLIGGVIAVQPIAEDFQHLMAVNQAKSDLRKRLWEVLR